MTQVIEIIKAQYDTLEVPFGRSYRWHQAQVVFECDCGEKPIVKMSALTGSRLVCVCGADLTADSQEKQGHQPEVHGQLLEDYEATHHPWLHDPQAQAEQHLRDEATYPEEGSPWRYNDITSRGTDNERNVR
ncbi:MAG TPA: hypothetical protein VI027_08830 [Rubrobacteraceae bacterium]